ncbi:MAG: ABC transporter permease [bacterium]|nr:ABC transporter permease [bacterium]
MNKKANKTVLVFKHEFFYTVKRRGFAITTFSVPVIVFLAIVIGHLIAKSVEAPAATAKTIGYVDQVGTFNAGSAGEHAWLIPFKTKADATQALIKNKVPEYFVIPADYMTTQTVQLYSLGKKLERPFFTRAMIKGFLTSRLLSGQVPLETIKVVTSPLNLKFQRLSKSGAIVTGDSRIGKMVLAGIFAFLLGLSLMLNANYLLQGLGEEKESRLIEVLLSSVYVRQLLTGKVLGLGAAGLLQVLVWLLSAPLLITLAPSSMQAYFSSIHIPLGFYFLALLYFVLGYLLFAVLSIGVGAISPNARDGQTLALFYTMCSFVPLWFLSLLMMFPNSPIWVVLSIFPVTAPVQILLRMGFVEVPILQIVTSVVVLGISIKAGLSAAIKIFRVHLLMHGKRPTIKEILQNLKNV